jgi:hypothetical protein
MPDPTPPPASIGIEEQIAWMEQAIAEFGTSSDATAPKVYEAIYSTLRRVPALERVAEAAREREEEDQRFDALPETVQRGDYIAQMVRRHEVREKLRAALAATKEP